MEYGPDLSGGVGTHARELARGLARAGHEVDVLAFSPEGSGVTVDGGARVHRVCPRGSAPAAGRRSRSSMVEGITAFNEDLIAYGRELLGARSADVVQYYNWLTSSAARALGQELGIQVLGRFSFLSEPIERWWGQIPDPEIVEREREVFRHPDPAIACSRSMAEVIAEAHGVPVHGMDVIYNGMDEEDLDRPRLAVEARRRLRQSIAADDERIVLFAGRLNPMKGVTVLLRSALQVLAAEPRVRYLFAGEPDSRDFQRVLDELLADHSELRRCTTFLGRVPRKQLGLLYQVADVAVMPSIYEPFGWVAIEAMAAGLPLVASASGGPAEIVLDRRTGRLVAVRPSASGRREVDVEELAAAQVEILRDAEMARTMGEEGRRRVHTDFTRRRMIESTLRTYRQVARPAGSGAL